MKTDATAFSITRHPLATAALQAVAIRRRCGRQLASDFARSRGASALYRLALQLEATK